MIVLGSLSVCCFFCCFFSKLRVERTREEMVELFLVQWYTFYLATIIVATIYARCHVLILYSLLQTGEYTGLHCEPKMADLMNEIAVKLPHKWQDIGRGLGVEEYELKQIQIQYGWQQSTNIFFSSVFEKWHSGE